MNVKTKTNNKHRQNIQIIKETYRKKKTKTNNKCRQKNTNKQKIEQTNLLKT